MKKICRFVFAVGLVLVAAPVWAQSSCPSPTGHTPKLLWSSQQQCIWNRMKAENHPWYQLILANANGQRYADLGRWEMLAYQITADPTYAQRAFGLVDAWTTHFTLDMGANEIREYGTELVTEWNWLQPALSVAQSDLWLAWMKTISEKTVLGQRFGDSDQLTGAYFQLAAMDQVADTNYLSRSVADLDTGEMKTVGGLEASGADLRTMRNDIRRFVEVMAAGGQWIESSNYNHGTLQLLFLGWRALLAATGVEHFPEIAALLPQTTRWAMHELTPDLKQPFQWGDVQDPHRLQFYELDDLYSFLGNLNSDDALNAQMRQFADDVNTANGNVWRAGGEPLYARAFYFADPYGAKAPWRTPTGTLITTPGTGHVYWRTGWAINDRACHIWWPAVSNGSVDHQQNSFGDVVCYRKGRWTLDHPLGYTPDIRYTNSVSVLNAGGSWEAGGVLASGQKPGTYAYAAGTNAGVSALIYPGYALNVPTFLHENTREIFHLLDGDADVLVLFDRVNADDPRTGDWTTRYPYPYQQAAFTGALGLKDWIWHMPIQPTITGSTITWAGAGGANISVRQVLPSAPPIYTTVDETKDTTLGGYIDDAEKKWAVHAVLPNHDGFDTALNVLTFSEASASVTSTPLASSSGAPMQGVSIARPNLPTVSIVFSAQPGPRLTTTIENGRVRYDGTKIELIRKGRLIATPVTLSLPIGVTYFADLDPALAWPALTKEPGDVRSLTMAAAGIVMISPTGVVPPPPDPSCNTTEPQIFPGAFTQALKAGARGSVQFALTSPANRSIVSMTAHLDAKRSWTLTTDDASNLAGLFYGPLPIGSYNLVLTAKDDAGCEGSTGLRRRVTVTP